MTYGHEQLHLRAIWESFSTAFIEVRFCTSEMRIIHVVIVVFMTTVILQFMNIFWLQNKTYAVRSMRNGFMPFCLALERP